mmetsp:Transcript_177367/g.568735  ORF Transcript_177367/g.568735 Transcript_177367/m.568735 type:complete len:323 (+) Transcript_177367:793-1761(+)
MHVLQRRGVVVLKRQVVAGLDEEWIRSAHVAHVVAQGSDEHRENLCAADPLLGLREREQSVDAVHHIGCMNRIMVRLVHVPGHGGVVEGLEGLQVRVVRAGDGAEPRVEEDVDDDLLPVVRCQLQQVQCPAVDGGDGHGELREELVGRAGRVYRFPITSCQVVLVLHIHHVHDDPSGLVAQVVSVHDHVLQRDARDARELVEDPLQQLRLVRSGVVVLIIIRRDVLVLRELQDGGRDLPDHRQHSLEGYDNQPVDGTRKVRGEAHHDRDDAARHQHVYTVLPALRIREVDVDGGLNFSLTESALHQALRDLQLDDVLVAHGH